MPEITALNTIYNWFKRLDKPSYQQFYNTFFSFRHKSDKIIFDDLHDDVKTIINNSITSETIAPLLPITLAAGTSSWLVPAGTLIEKIWFKDADNPAVSIGKTIGGNELLEAVQLSNGRYIVSLDEPFDIDTTIYFTGITGNTITKIFKG
ncbi:MAG: hypothetical protein JWP81_12 [Ferruginibacter sp.]|nr:hypothetical protein [Ferruginibacter sp.]